MSFKETRLVEEFQAVSDGGESYEVLVYQEFIDASSMGNPNQWIPGLKEAVLDGGGHVNWIDDTTFKIVSSGEIIRRIH